MRLVAFGCSNTYGQALPDTKFKKNTAAPPASKFSWPSVLAEKLNIECVNKGVPGASNKLISHVIRNTEFQDDDIVIVLWSYVDRWCIIDKDGDQDWTSHGHNAVAPWAKNRRSMNYFRYLYNEVDHIIETNHRIDYANLYLKSLGIKQFHSSCESIIHPLLFDINFKVLRKIDIALDNTHPGIEAHKAIAETFYKRITQ